jgi:hypothetical protein
MAGSGLYVAVLLVAFSGARVIHEHAVRSLYAHETATAVYVSVGFLSSDAIATLARSALADPAVRGALAPHEERGERFINYVMPTDLLISEVPMHLPPGARTGHRSPRTMDQSRYKIIFTVAHFGVSDPPPGRAMLLRAVNKSPVVEAWIERSTGEVERVLPPPAHEIYGGMPVPVF